MSTIALILAAGFGKRMQSSKPKVLHTISGDPALLWVLRALPTNIKTAVIVLHHGKEQIKQAIEEWIAKRLLSCSIIIVDQGQPLGTGHAVQQATQTIDQLVAEKVLILYGDVPLIQTKTILNLSKCQNAILAMDISDPTGYGRILETPDGYLKTIIEQDDASQSILTINRVNGGPCCVLWQQLKFALKQITNNNNKKEFYLTDALIQIAKNSSVEIKLCSSQELIGMNSRRDQAILQEYAKDRINNYWMNQGVTFINPNSTIIGPRVLLNMDIILAQNISITGQTSVGIDNYIGDGCILSDCKIGNNNFIKPYCVINKANIDDNCIIGPFANLREGSVLKNNVHIGDFLEIKKSVLHPNVKANHLSYIGDAEVGEGSNLGAGIITCNYDGVNKYKTIIGKNVFLGSDCQLIAPIVIGDNSIIGAGSTVNKNIPVNCLAIARSPLSIKEECASKLRQKNITKKMNT